MTLRALARLLCYPSSEMVESLPDVAQALAQDRGLSAGTRRELAELTNDLLRTEWLEAEARYVDTFDRGRRTSLHLFEHVHGDSRERGPAMIDLHQHYAAAGLHLADGELPDYLPAVLEFASTQPPQAAREFLAEMAHILNALHTALRERKSPYAAPIAAVLELAGEAPKAVAVPAEEPLDATWAEPEPFGGCSSAGQQAPSQQALQPQPIQIVRPAAHGNAAAQRGAAA